MKTFFFSDKIVGFHFFNVCNQGYICFQCHQLRTLGKLKVVLTLSDQLCIIGGDNNVADCGEKMAFFLDFIISSVYFERIQGWNQLLAISLC